MPSILYFYTPNILISPSPSLVDTLGLMRRESPSQIKEPEELCIQDSSVIEVEDEPLGRSQKGPPWPCKPVGRSPPSVFPISLIPCLHLGSTLPYTHTHTLFPPMMLQASWQG